MHCKSTLRRVKLFSEGIHTPEYTLFLPSTCPINRDHLTAITLKCALRSPSDSPPQPQNKSIAVSFFGTAIAFWCDLLG